MKMLKNIPYEQAVAFAGLVEYGNGQVVSRTLLQNKNHSMTMFAFDAGEEISSHESSGDAFVLLLEGSALITIGDKTHAVKGGESIVMPAKVPHALRADTPFKMLLVVIFDAK